MEFENCYFAEEHFYVVARKSANSQNILITNQQKPK